MTAQIDISRKAIDDKRLFTIEEYYKMGEAGIFDNERVELINGIIYYMSPIGSPHRGCVAHIYEELLLQFLYSNFGVNLQLQHKTQFDALITLNLNLI